MPKTDKPKFLMTNTGASEPVKFWLDRGGAHDLIQNMRDLVEENGPDCPEAAAIEEDLMENYPYVVFKPMSVNDAKKARAKSKLFRGNMTAGPEGVTFKKNPMELEGEFAQKVCRERVLEIHNFYVEDGSGGYREIGSAREWVKLCGESKDPTYGFDLGEVCAAAQNPQVLKPGLGERSAW